MGQLDFSLLGLGTAPPVPVPDPVDSKWVRSGLRLTFCLSFGAKSSSPGRDTGLGRGCQRMGGLPWVTLAQLPELSRGGSPSVPDSIPRAPCCRLPDLHHLAWQLLQLANVSGTKLGS